MLRQPLRLPGSAKPLRRPANASAAPVNIEPTTNAITVRRRATVPPSAGGGAWRTMNCAITSEEKLFSYWDYRAGDFHEHRGMRIDLVLLSQPLAESVTWALVDRNARKGKLPSDHAPVLVDVNVPTP